MAGAQIMPLPTPPIIGRIRHVSIGAVVRLQNPGDRTWHGLRPQYLGGDPPQASPDGFLPNDLAGLMNRPSPIAERVRATAARILAPLDPALRLTRPAPPELLTFDTRLTQEELRDLLSIMIQFYVRDASQDLMFPPPARVATVVLTEVVLYQRATEHPPLWPSGPIVSVETVVRANATEWLFGKLDAAVERVLARLIPL